ncbi:hypothetical protein [Streptomyces albireticuli]|uniref:Uncharacterized protein n=1 Tax=Streptomyces albireticuli TaxID=1940 RepID=A0A2A2D7P5_9ACTN|nr:hypothetical protein [Streptomyces albireticuli]MCD9144354.1 hypothetical protein [Streptomyces albireticuli]MCD9162003.1 hypothetical protein [Streptomyces albireticuli]MCD9193991.1 hypothetical protein [Streptomyces albireticuli]PAU47521.1 hypothetical protein CK936_18165 [Streptomyces albireticuli]
MSPDLITAAALAGPGLLLAPVCLIGHRLQARHDNAAAAVIASYHPLQPTDPDPPHGGGEPVVARPGPELPDNVISFPTHRRDRAA